MARTPKRDGAAFGFNPGEAPDYKGSQLTLDLGVTGLRSFAGFVREEWVPNLIGRQGATVYREMLDSSPVVGAVMFAIAGVMRKAEWRVIAASDKGDDQKSVEFVTSLMHDMSGTWEDFITEALSMLGYGYSFHEIVYKRRHGERPKRSNFAGSKHDDGLIGWRRLPIRSQDTILKWYFDDNGQVLGAQQQPWVGHLVDIPIEKALLFRPTLHKHNPEGRALDPDTPVPTPDGWRRLDDLAEGSKVFDENGRIRYVTARADWDDRPCYRVTFGDGTSIIADANHQWVTQNLYERTKAKPGKVRTTAEIAKSVKASGGSSNHAIGWASALDYPEQLLPIDPYVLGLWLGDGHSRAATITCHADDIEETTALIEAAGYPVEAKTNGVADGLGRLIRFYG